MTRSVRALVNPELLVWTRENAGFSQDDFSRRFKKPLELVQAWEEGEANPTVSQARAWAKACGRPLAVLYLPSPPYHFAPLEDFRRIDPSVGSEPSSWLKRAIRLARDRRALVLDLLEDDEDATRKPWTLEIPAADAEEAGRRLREFVGVDLSTQRRHGKGRGPWTYWKTLVEDSGALVFQMERVDLREARGFSIYSADLPVIVLNPSDSPRGRVFTLLHEMAHLGLRSSGICDRGEDSTEEAYCNAAAAAALMPRADFLGQLIGMRGEHHWTEQRISDLADMFGASREASVRRLLTVGYVSKDFYLRKRAQYQAENARQRKRQEGKDVRLRREVLSLVTNGPVLVGAAFRAHWDGRIGIGELAAITDVQVGKIGRLREEFLRRG